MDDFFFLTLRQRKRKLAFFHESLLEGASHLGNLGDKNRKPRGPTRDRNVRKEQWTKLYNQKSDKEFSEKMRINRITFNLLLNTLWDGLVLTPTNFVPEPTSPDRQLAALLYRLAHGVTYTVLEDVFGISKESGCVFFNKVIRLIVTC